MYDEPNSTLLGVLTFLPQMSLVVVSGFALYFDLFLACFVQVYCFVAYNKVMTAQYYMWFMSFYPLILCNNRMATCQKWRFVAFQLAFIFCQCIWGVYANAFENEGRQTLVGIQAANFAFFVTNLVICLSMLHFQ